MKAGMTFLRLSLWVGCAMIHAAQEAQTPKPTFAIVIDVPLTSVSPGLRIPCIVTMTNVSGHDLPLEGGRRIFELPNEVERLVAVMVYDADGTRVPETEYGRMVYGRRPQMMLGKTVCCDQWKFGGSFVEESDLNREFNLNKPGKYTVEASRYDYEVNGLVKSNRISLTIVAAAREAQASKVSISLNAAVPAVSFQAGSPIPLTATITNNCSHDVSIPKEYNYRLAKEVPNRLIIQVFDSEGRPVQTTAYGKSTRVDEASTRVHGLVAATLKPGETYKEEADLSKEFDLTTPGTYTVEVQKRDPDTGQRLRSNKITFTVTQ